MKRLLKAYMSFTRTERMGLAGLSVLLLILLAVRISLHWFVQPDIDAAQQHRLNIAWKQFKQAHADDSLSAEEDFMTDNKERINKISSSDILNINTADSEALVSLKGIGPVLAHRIIEKRKQLGHFTNFGQLLQIPRFPKKDSKLLKHLQIK